jgi:hypothetical protein
LIDCPVIEGNNRPPILVIGFERFGLFFKCKARAAGTGIIRAKIEG